MIYGESQEGYWVNFLKELKIEAISEHGHSVSMLDAISEMEFQESALVDQLTQYDTKPELIQLPASFEELVARVGSGNFRKVSALNISFRNFRKNGTFYEYHPGRKTAIF